MISWKSKNCRIRSSAKSKYQAMTNASCELNWIQSLMGELGFALTSPIQLYSDDQVAHISKILVFHK